MLVGNAPRLGLGLAAIGRPGYINLGREKDLAPPDERTPEALRDRAWEVLDAAWASGVRYYDCARSYGKSEEFLSGWLAARSYSRDDVAIGSKWGYRYTADWRVDAGGLPHEVKDHSLSHLQSQQLESTQLLGSHLRLYQIHSATLESGVLDDAAVLSELTALKVEKGWKIGLSLSGVNQSLALDKAVRTGVFDAVQATWNLLEPSAGAALLRAREAGFEIIIKEAMANGRILRRPKLLEVASQLGVAPDALALAAAMAQDFKPVVLSGAVTAAQLQSNMEAVAVAERLMHEDSSIWTKLQELRMDPEAYWKERSELAWS